MFVELLMLKTAKHNEMCWGVLTFGPVPFARERGAKDCKDSEFWCGSVNKKA